MVLILCFFIGSISAQSETKKLVLAIHKNRYVNYPYGYRFKIPKGLTGTCSPPPMPQHGLTINLAGDTEQSRRIGFFAFYDVNELGTLENVVKEELKELQSGTQIHTMAKRKVRFGGIQGLHLTYKLEGNPIERFLFYRKNGKVIYDAYLRTTQQYYRQDTRIFQQIMATWRFKPLS